MWEKIRNRLTVRRKRFSKSESGAAAVEFALVALPFFMLLGVILEQGIVMFVEYTLQAAVQDASRLVRTGQAQNAAFTASQFKTKVCNLASVLIDCTGSVTVYMASDASFGTLKSKLPSFLNVGLKADGTPNPSSYNCGGPLQTTAVVATYDWTFIMPFMNFDGNIAGGTKRRIVGFSMFQNEPFPATGAGC
jgi:Flp pilus assembly protein TadG